MTRFPNENKREYLMTYSECAKELGVTVSQMRKYVASRQLKVIDLGHCTKRIRESEFDRFLNRRERR